MKLANCCGFTRVVLSAAALALFSSTAFLIADDAKPAAEAKKSARRLPPYYAQVVSPDQREEIYALQGEYEPKFAELEAKLAALHEEANAAYLAVLDADQQQKLDELVAAGKEKRKNRQKSEQASAAQ